MFWFLLLLIGVAFVLLLNQSDYFDDNKNISTKNKQAIDVLNERYARGELDTDEYINIKKNLIV